MDEIVVDSVDACCTFVKVEGLGTAEEEVIGVTDCTVIGAILVTTIVDGLSVVITVVGEGGGGGGVEVVGGGFGVAVAIAVTVVPIVVGMSLVIAAAY